MTTTPTLPPLPDPHYETDDIPSYGQIDQNCYTESHMKAYALSAYESGRQSVLDAVADDAYAISFPTMGQYRQALLKRQS